jgi:hypothetical protein
MGKHTATQRGRRVEVVRRDGTVLAGRFLDRTPKGGIVLDTGKVRKRDVAKMLLVRGGHNRPGAQ